MKTKISRIMSTQHPDNVTIPFFANSATMTGDDEVQEAFYAYSHLNVDEQLWDVEGKEVDNYVVQKLLSKYSEYFKDVVLGQDKFLTLRAPNPAVEKSEAKVLGEIIYSIPKNHDLATHFYGKDSTPIFEIVLPMCQDDKQLVRVHDFYETFIKNSQTQRVGDTTLSLWLGEFKPAEIRVTPLFETKEEILNAHIYVKNYVKAKNIRDQQRVWFARSDPALNYGSVAAILLVKVALQRIHKLESELGVELLPIIGMGSSPFRGNFKPSTAKQILKGYPSVQTFTIQSAFKYDYPLKEVVEAIDFINKQPRSAALQINEEEALHYIDVIHDDYADSIKELEIPVNSMSNFIPNRRKRKLHTGLFGYSRNSNGVKLPRAIKFCCALYSFGLPPEVLGLASLSRDDIERIKRAGYANIDYDLSEALQYLNVDNLDYFTPKIKEKVLRVASLFKYEVNEPHKRATSQILESLKRNDQASVSEWIIKAAHIRRFLG
ncbi:MAG: phosphoenolpyruvate carboxylase [archaeon]